MFYVNPMVDNLLGKTLKVRLKTRLPPAYEKIWQAKFGSESSDTKFVPVYCGTLHSIDKSMNLVLENVHIGAMKCDSGTGQEKSQNEAQIATFQSLFIRGSNVQYAEIVE